MDRDARSLCLHEGVTVMVKKEIFQDELNKKNTTNNSELDQMVMTFQKIADTKQTEKNTADFYESAKKFLTSTRLRK